VCVSYKYTILWIAAQHSVATLVIKSNNRIDTTYSSINSSKCPNKQMTTYSAELSKSARASCKRCKEKIDKDVIRIGMHSASADGIEFTSWTHLLCFNPPKKMGIDEFLDHLNMNELSEENRAHVRSALVSRGAPAPTTAVGGGAETKKRTSSSGDVPSGGDSATKKSRLVRYCVCHEMMPQIIPLSCNNYYDKYILWFELPD
jgi:hypothetical protein